MNQWVEVLNLLRNARAEILRDSESFHEAVTTLEHLGQILAKQVRNGLGQYEREIVELACKNQRHDSAEVARLFKVVREARNMAVHEGAWARHLSSRLVDLFLILEEAVMIKMEFVEDIMVRNPVVVQTWQLVACARKTMLENSFSSLPIFFDGRWRLLTDIVVMRFLRAAESKKDSIKRLSMQLGAAIEENRLEVTEAVSCLPRTHLCELIPKMNVLPVLVTQEINDEPRLIGIITPFDLL